jgi:hypothetical protein
MNKPIIVQSTETATSKAGKDYQKVTDAEGIVYANFGEQMEPNKAYTIDFEGKEFKGHVYYTIKSYTAGKDTVTKQPATTPQSTHVDTSKPSNASGVDSTRRSIERQKALDITAQHLRFDGDTIDTILERAEKVYNWIAKAP